MNSRPLRKRPSACLTRAWPLALVLAVWGCGGSIDVETIRPRRGRIRESFTEPARTRLANDHVISMPVAGRIGRISLEPGDRVTKGQALATFDLVPFEAALTEAKAAVAELQARIVLNQYDEIEKTVLVEADATIRATSHALDAAEAQVAAEKARSERAAKELGRVTTLATQDAVTEAQLDDARLAADTSLIELRRQEFYHAALKGLFVAIRLGPKYVSQYLGRKRLNRGILNEQLAQAKARLARAEHDLKTAKIASPIDGVVLERFEQGDRPMLAGDRLLRLGDLAELEVVADVLTQDAMRLAPGPEVRMEPAAGFPPFTGKVTRVEPAGFTKLSSLGVEQQRVNVIVDITGHRDRLGVGYRLHAQFFTGTKDKALIVPRFSVLQARDRSFYVLKVEAGLLKEHPVKIGLRSDLELEIVSGLGKNDVIVAEPDTTMRDGTRVAAD